MHRHYIFSLLFETLSDLQNHVRSWCYRGSDRKRPRLESQSSEEEENDNIAFIKMAYENKKETEERFKAHVQKYQTDGFTLKQAKEEAEILPFSYVLSHFLLSPI